MPSIWSTLNSVIMGNTSGKPVIFTDEGMDSLDSKLYKHDQLTDKSNSQSKSLPPTTSRWERSFRKSKNSRAQGYWLDICFEVYSER